METIYLSKDAKKLLKKIYKKYKKRRKSGLTKSDAKLFGSSTDILKEIVPEWRSDDVLEACWELDEAELLSCLPGDDEIQMALLTNSGIAYAEGRLVNLLNAICNAIKEIIPLIPSGY